MKDKVCSKCKKHKPLNQFYKMKISKDGYRPSCKECDLKSKKKDALKYRIDNMASGIIKRTKWDVDKPKNKCYKNVKNLLGDSISEIKLVILDNFKDEIEKMIKDGEKPSIDRIDSNGDYELSNIQIVSFEQNYRNGLSRAVEKCSKPIKAIFANGEILIFKSVSECSRELNLKRDTIINHRDNKTKTKHGISFYELK